MNAKFICDVMLGRLARWLRLLGFDTLYSRTISDNEIVNIARQQYRIVLTRDSGIAKRKGSQKTVLIHSNNTFEQLKEVLHYLQIPPSLKPRCTLCNGKLKPAEPDEITSRVPEYVFLNATSFLTCPDCGKVYWQGSHKKSIDSILKKVVSSK